MKDFLRWFSDEKLVIISLAALGIIAAALQEWQTAGICIGAFAGYLKGRSDGEKATPAG